ncbi:unnamed protein product [Triticum turgidum subsp. durum]|uniref:Uncharacterized protein n=1 Tax=Triticum turgidum subsp. durum TaxID=4567 RepID=A0A9R1S6K2_TRITD|nr:unnamed protein product [Triticum turgidum subsp. durum]
MHNNGGCVQRVSGPIGGILYSLCTSPSGLIAVGGTDRAVTIYDPRRWSALSRWVGCSKYEITGLSFSSVDQSFMYVQGVDYEITCGRWRESKRAFSFRGDSNWLGFSKCANTDVVAGWCESGSIFVADVRQDLLSAQPVSCSGYPWGRKFLVGSCIIRVMLISFAVLQYKC